MLCPRFRSVFFAAALGVTALASAQQSTTIDLTGVVFRNAVNQSRSSTTPISPAFLYNYVISGFARGVGGALGIRYPNPTPLAQIFEDLSPGSSALLSGQGANDAGIHPYLITNQRFDGSTVISGITVTYGFDLRIEISAAGIVSFSLTNVVLQPAILIGYLQITSGNVLITRTPGVIGGSLQYQDFVGDPTSMPLTLELRTPGTQNVVETIGVLPTPAGTWFAQTSQRGTFDVAAKGPHWLRKTLGSITITDTGRMDLNYSLVNGDINGDNEVGITDYAVLSAQYNTEGPDADLNGDFYVDIADYSILSARYSQFGDD